MEPNVAQILEHRARLTPNRVGLVEWESARRFRFSELEERACRLAAWLSYFGVKKGERVSIIALNGVYYVDLFFALAKLGAIFTPINWRLAVPEMEYILKDAQPKAIFYEEDFSPQVRELRAFYPNAEWISLSNYEERLFSFPPEAPEVKVGLEDPHTIFYTSGTTGRPKGAILPHRMILWNSVNTIVSWGLTCEDVFPVFTPMFHSGGFNVGLIPLIHVGGRSVVVRKFEPSSALRLIEQEKATVVFMVPTMFQILAEAPEFWNTDWSSVRFAISGGAPCPVELIKLYQSRGIVFKQGFGMTEAGVNCFSMAEEEAFLKPGSVGKPIFHSAVKIVNEEGREVGDEEVGELLIAGPHVCAGYWQKPEETAETIVEGWIHTGDLAKRDKDGFYYIVGRKKEMFISGGENVYMAEVEMVLNSHPKVKEAAVIPIPDPKWGEVGRAVVVLRPGMTATEEEIKAFCEGKLARYKIPKSVVFTDEPLPRNPYGKLLRSELIKRYGER